MTGPATPTPAADRPSAASLERLIPGELAAADVTGLATLQLHLERYRYAARFVDGGSVLDCACGAGYGSALLAEGGNGEPFVTGVDIDPAAIAYAAREYRADRTRFLVADAAELQGDPFDTIVSFEMIEHVVDPRRVVGNLISLLKPGGVFVASAPITPSVDVNPYHLHDFSARSLRALFEGLIEVDNMVQVQPYSPLRMLRGRETRLADMRENLLGYYRRHPLAAARRLYSTLIDGFCNKYLVCAFRKPA